MIFVRQSNRLMGLGLRQRPPLRLWCLGVGLFMRALTAHAQVWDCYDFQTSEVLPDLVLANRSVALVASYVEGQFQQAATRAFAQEVQAAFATTGIDMVWTAETPFVFASKATQQAFLTRIRRRDIAYWTAFSQHIQGEKKHISLRIGRFAAPDEVAQTGQRIFYLAEESIDDLVARFEQKLVSQGIVSANFLVNAHPEWMPSFRSAALVGKTGGAIPEDAWKSGLVVQWPHAHPCKDDLSRWRAELDTLFVRHKLRYTFNPDNTPDRTLYKQGYNYALHLIHAPAEVLKGLLPDAEVPSPTAPAYFVYLRHLLSQKRAMPVRAYRSLSEALQQSFALPR